MSDADPTDPRHRGPQLWVRGVDDAGAQLLLLPLPHGADPEDLLADAGYASTGVRGVTGTTEPHALVLEYAVRPGDGIPADRRVPRHDPDLRLAPGEVPRRRQRVAVYALCSSDRGVLLTQFSGQTNAPFRWGLPGGGIDAGELPEDALHREIHEETGQEVAIEGFLGLHDAHWVGRAPSGVVEDFHAVRLVYRASCAEPSAPVVHDVGGTTLSAAWVPVEQVGATALTGVWRDILAVWLPGLAREPAPSVRADPPPRPGPAGHPAR